ncbi:MAG: cation-efflux pump [Methanomassiliicoccus sp.]|nr:cation-efflux pump [Methanomassiliicoccus sp.]
MVNLYIERIRSSQGGLRTHVKERVALFSVLAAVLLTATKLIVGYYTNSLGIISEALHSGIDLIAAAMTLFAVRASARPPDADHMYGHDKIESLSSLGETALLFITCGWIVYEAFNRLFFHSPEVEVGVIALLVMVMSMVIDYTRSRALLRTARMYKSQALEADAMHFTTDLISSTMVIIGILFTMAGFKSFDAIAALGVAAVTAVIGYRLWKRSVHTLMDGAPEGLSVQVTDEVMAMPGIHRVERVRIRESGPITFVEATVQIDMALPLEQGHRLTEEVEQRIRSVVPGADVVIHAEPVCLEYGTLEERIRAESTTLPEVRSVHNIVITDLPDGRLVEFHLELDGEQTVEKAHGSATRLEETIARLDPCIVRVISHIEPFCCQTVEVEASGRERTEIMETVEMFSERFPEVLSCRDIQVHSTRSGYRVSLCCQFDPDLSVVRAHEVATKLEGAIRSKHPDIDSVTIHLEPAT